VNQDKTNKTQETTWRVQSDFAQDLRSKSAKKAPINSYITLLSDMVDDGHANVSLDGDFFGWLKKNKLHSYHLALEEEGSSSMIVYNNVSLVIRIQDIRRPRS
jgi:hypothetical protein